MSRAVLGLLLALQIVAVFCQIDGSNIDQEFENLRLFGNFKSQFGKQYSSLDVEAYRYNIFKRNVAKAQEMNDAAGETTFGVTKFSDLTADEFRRQRLGFRPDTSVSRPKFQVVSAPHTAVTSFDWRTKGAVSPVKDQGQCGSCWAFSAVEETESAWFLAGHPMVELSPQQVVSCDTVDGGCDGGDTPTAYDYIEKNGLEAESSYPYTSGDSGDSGSCTYKSGSVVVHMSNWTYATPACFNACTKQDEATLLNNMVAHAPVSICVDAEPWQFYSSGVMKASSCASSYDDLDHCVQLVAFNTDSTGNKYWIVRNSWNTDWGNDGYIYLEYGSNTCGVADEATIAFA